MPINSDYRGPKLVGRSNYIKWQKEANIFLEIGGYILYINSFEQNLLNYKFLYYNNVNIIRSPKLAIKYIKQKTEFKYNIKKVLGTIKIILLNNNKDYFKNKKDTSQL